MKETVFLVNPRAGSGRAARVWDELRAAVPDLAGAEVITAADPADAARALDRRLGAAADASAPLSRLIVVGGDGSVHLALNRLFESGRQGEVALGLIPMGTGSDLARSLGLPRDHRQALERALAASPREIDVLEVATATERRRVLNVTSAGISGLVVGLVNARPVRSPATFLLSTLQALGRYTPSVCRIELDGEPWYEGGLFVLAVANGRSFGRGMLIAPRAELDDGLADVVLVRPMPRWQIPLRMPRLYRGTHLDEPSVTWRRARRIRLEPLGPLPPFDVDGEMLPSGAAEFEVLPRALRFLA